MRSFDHALVDRTLHLVRLLTPGYDKMTPSLGYIQAYPPGIRENGGQYTHGVIWSVVAWAMMGCGDKAFELFSLLNPVLRTGSFAGARIYGNEPYVMSADIYTAPYVENRAGWSWYTGSASWMYQAGLESVLGITRRGNRLYIQPCVPQTWDAFAIDYRLGSTTYQIHVELHHGNTAASQWIIDGKPYPAAPYLTLAGDGQSHIVICQVPMVHP
jgi:cyclic beta-1,2-glucan synthetase